MYFHISVLATIWK